MLNLNQTPLIGRLVLVGRLARDIDLRFTPSGIAVAEFTLAVTARCGQKKDTIFINVNAWRTLAELMEKHSYKGQAILVEGRLAQDKYEKNGMKITKTYVVAEKIQFLSWQEPACRQTG